MSFPILDSYSFEINEVIINIQHDLNEELPMVFYYTLDTTITHDTVWIKYLPERIDCEKKEKYTLVSYKIGLKEFVFNFYFYGGTINSKTENIKWLQAYETYFLLNRLFGMIIVIDGKTIDFKIYKETLNITKPVENNLFSRLNRTLLK